MSLSNTEGAPIWLDLFTPDPAGAAAFYAAIAGWDVNPPSDEFGGYQIFAHHGGPIAGMMLNDGSQGMPPAWTIYLETPDVEATAAKIAEHGGTVVMPPMAVGDMGKMLFAIDPAGAYLGAWEPGSNQGFHVRGEVGAPAWFETNSKDFTASTTFYQNAFAWDLYVLSDRDDFRFSTLGEGEDALAGIMDSARILPPEVPSHWTFYLEVVDTDATIAQALELGGRLLQGPEDSPYGRLAELADPQGASFNLMQTPG